MIQKVIHGECLEELSKIEDNSVNLILTDLPFGVTQNHWDCIIPLDSLWKEYYRIAKKNAAIVLNAMQPFTSILICSNLKDFKYNWIWHKSRPSGHLNAKRQPLREHEDVCIFYRKQPIYNPQFTKGAENHVNNKPHTKSQSSNYGQQYEIIEEKTNEKYPKSILPFTVVSPSNVLHPNQKPLPLCEYMIKTYTNEGDLVLDSTCGSGTTLLAAKNLNRQFIGIEQNKEYYDIILERLKV